MESYTQFVGNNNWDKLILIKKNIFINKVVVPCLKHIFFFSLMFFFSTFHHRWNILSNNTHKKKRSFVKIMHNAQRKWLLQLLPHLFFFFGVCYHTLFLYPTLFRPILNQHGQFFQQKFIWKNFFFCFNRVINKFVLVLSCLVIH